MTTRQLRPGAPWRHGSRSGRWLTAAAAAAVVAAGLAMGLHAAPAVPEGVGQSSPATSDPSCRTRGVCHAEPTVMLYTAGLVPVRIVAPR